MAGKTGVWLTGTYTCAPRVRTREARVVRMPGRDVPPDDVRCTYMRSNGKRCGQLRLDPGSDDFTWCEYHATVSSRHTPLPQLRGEPGALARVSPMQVLLEEIERAQIMVRWYEGILADKEPEELMSVTITETREGGPGGGYDLVRTEPRPHPALVLLKDERAHLANITRMAIQSGIESRQLELNEQMADTIITAMFGFARLAGMDPSQPAVKEWVTTALRAAREGRTIEGQLVSTPASHQPGQDLRAPHALGPGQAPPPG